MKNTIKGALAVGTAGVILLGGAGSLAYWSATANATAGSITTGSLSLTAAGCDTAWTYASGAAAGATATVMVPGDSITKSCRFTVAASGDHLTAALTAPATLGYTRLPAASSGTGTDKFAVATTYTINRTTTATLINGDELTSGDNTKTLTAKFVVTMPFGDASSIDANDTQGLNVSLNQLSVTLTQDKSSLNNPNA